MWSRTRTDAQTDTHTHTACTHTHARGRQLGYASLSPLWLGSVPPKILERSEQASVAIRTRTSYRTVSFDSYAHRFLSFLCLLLSFCPPFLTVSLPPRCVVASLLYQMELHRLESYFHRERLAWSRTRDPPNLCGTLGEGTLLQHPGFPITESLLSFSRAGVLRRMGGQMERVDSKNNPPATVKWEWTK